MSTGLDVFDTSLEKTNLLLKNIEEDFGWEGRRHQAYAALRAVLHAFRDRLQVDDAINFSAQLPLFLKGVFLDGWQPDEVPIKMNKDEFLNRIQSEFIFDYKGDTTNLVQIVFTHIFEIVDPFEAEKIKKTLPEDIRELLEGI